MLGSTKAFQLSELLQSKKQWPGSFLSGPLAPKAQLAHSTTAVRCLLQGHEDPVDFNCDTIRSISEPLRTCRNRTVPSNRLAMSMGLKCLCPIFRKKHSSVCPHLLCKNCIWFYMVCIMEETEVLMLLFLHHSSYRWTQRPEHRWILWGASGEMLSANWMSVEFL